MNQDSNLIQKEKIEKITNSFILAFLSLNVSINSNELAETFFTDYKKEFSKQEVLNKFKNIFSLYKTILNSNYSIDNIDFDYSMENEGYGVVEGSLNFSAKLTTDEVVNIESYFKLFVIYHEPDWKIFFFKLPGFTW